MDEDQQIHEYSKKCKYGKHVNFVNIHEDQQIREYSKNVNMVNI